MNHKFTLLELLIVIGILGILVSILIPSLKMARYKTHLAVDLSNQHQVYTGMASYAKDNKGKLPLPEYPGDKPWLSYLTCDTVGKVKDDPIHTGILYSQGYISDYSVFYCPISNIDGARHENYIDKDDGSWSTYDSPNYTATLTRAGYMVNALKYPYFHSETHLAGTGTYTFDTEKPLIYDWLIKGSKLFHTSDFTITMLNGSGSIRKSKPLYDRLMSGWASSGSETLGNNILNHSEALNYIVD